MRSTSHIMQPWLLPVLAGFCLPAAIPACSLPGHSLGPIQEAQTAEDPMVRIVRIIEAQDPGGVPARVSRDGTGAVAKLDLSRLLIRDRDIEAVSAVRSLTKLDLSYPPGVLKLAPLAQLPPLYRLNLKGHMMSDNYLEWLAHSPAVVNLHLTGSTNVGPNLQFVSETKELEALALDRTDVSDGDLELLTNCPSLKTLDLTGTRVSDAALDTLARLPKLNWLFLDNAWVTREGVARLRALRPDMDVLADDK